ncbi:DUF333 domain-containing protein [Patescibacteria group bacterium]|nr:DUF333 domain-containing protein [Patescibacteria group bacterium]
MFGLLVVGAYFVFFASETVDVDTDDAVEEVENIEEEQGFRKEPVACTLEAKICPDGSSVGRTGPNCEFSPCPNVGLANPASVYCVNNAGTLEIREGTGGQYGVCVFADGSECEEWAYFRGECEEGQGLD